jgi:hypothetical protein
MRARLMVIAVAAVSFAGAVAAEPAKAPVRKADQPAEQPVQVVVAAADQARPLTPATDAAAPAKRERKARVTTCRCGDQSASN